MPRTGNFKPANLGNFSPALTARAEGIELGINRDIEQGIEQLSKKMLSSGLPLEKIMEITGLTENKLQELSK